MGLSALRPPVKLVEDLLGRIRNQIVGFEFPVLVQHRCDAVHPTTSTIGIIFTTVTSCRSVCTARNPPAT